jgi:hypothetical protein
VKPGTKNAAEKRKKEINRQKWQAEKAERRQQRLVDRNTRASLNPDEDPDLAGIVPGPQPIEEPLSEAPLESPIEAVPVPSAEPTK